MGFLFLIFLVLKLLGITVVANWSWWWVTAPLWAPPVLLVGGFLIYLGFVALFSK